MAKASRTPLERFGGKGGQDALCSFLTLYPRKLDKVLSLCRGSLRSTQLGFPFSARGTASPAIDCCPAVERGKPFPSDLSPFSLVSVVAKANRPLTFRFPCFGPYLEPQVQTFYIFPGPLVASELFLAGGSLSTLPMAGCLGCLSAIANDLKFRSSSSQRFNPADATRTRVGGFPCHRSLFLVGNAIPASICLRIASSFFPLVGFKRNVSLLEISCLFRGP